MTSRLEVPDEIALHDVGFVTDVAAMPLDAHVELEVCIQVGPLVKGLAANLAAEGSATSAHSRMARKLGVVHEDLVAQRALECLRQRYWPAVKG